mgnify:CR=1 FL=1
MLLLRGGKISPVEGYVYTQVLLTQELLSLGYPYDVIESMGEEEVNRILGVHMAIKQKQQEDMQVR